MRRGEEIDPLAPLRSPMYAANTHATGFVSPRCDAKRSFTRKSFRFAFESPVKLTQRCSRRGRISIVTNLYRVY